MKTGWLCSNSWQRLRWRCNIASRCVDSSRFETSLYLRFIYHSLLSCCFLFAKRYICHRFQHDSWSTSLFLDVLPEERFFFLDLGSSRAFAQFHIMSVCLSWPDITSPGWARGVIFCHLIPLNTAALKSVKLWQRCHVCGVMPQNLQLFSPAIKIVCIRGDEG